MTTRLVSSALAALLLFACTGKAAGTDDPSGAAPDAAATSTDPADASDVTVDPDAGTSSSTDAATDAGTEPINTEPFPTMGGATAVTTFQSIGLYWKTTDGSATRACSVQYRKQGAFAWKQGLDLWFDARNGEYRGSLVLLEPGTAYQVKLAVAGTSATAQLTARTWSESFPVARTITLPATSNQTLEITSGGTASGYVLYTAAPGGSTIDVADAQDFCVRISAPYVIVHGLTLKNAHRDGIRIETGAHDLVIEDNDISGWGRVRDTAKGWGVNGDSGVHVAYKANGVDRVVIQRNYIHAPRFDSNDWTDGHPAGPLGTYFENCSLPDVATCGSNHVIRFNDVIGAPDHHFMDGIGGEDNFSSTGFPNADSDIYGNRVRYAWDDGIESEGADRNVRIWGNYLDETFTGIASATCDKGPLYIFRNVYDVSRQQPGGANDTNEHGPFGKLGDGDGYGGGRRYYLHNTLLQQPPPAGSQYGQGAGNGPLGGYGERPMTQVFSRNNLWHVYRSRESSLYGNPQSSENDVDYDLDSGSIDVSGMNNRIGTHNLSGTPTYAPDNGAVSRDGGKYALAKGTPGFDAAQVLPNFNDGFVGAGPDIGAQEAGAPAMKFGRDAAGPVTPPPPPTPRTLPFAIDVGGSGAGSFLADQSYSGGDPATNWTGAIDTTGVANAAPPAVYQSERYGDFTYVVDGLKAGTTYRVRLHFCENYFSAKGQRAFDVDLNGTKVLTAYDVFDAAGAAHRANVREFQSAADSGGALTMKFTTVVNNALVNGIEVLP